jgi:tRNA threonylcarbamoyladenosine biosynthesis protein TsaE
VRAPAESVLRWSAIASDAAATGGLGRALGRAAPDGATILLDGPLGAGKTTLAQGVARGCGVEVPVASPTYTLVLHYHGRRPFTHVDLYRLADSAALATLDLDEILGGDGVTCIEWPALVRSAVVPPWAEIAIERAASAEHPERRHITGRCVGEGWRGALDALHAAGARIEGGV